MEVNIKMETLSKIQNTHRLLSDTAMWAGDVSACLKAKENEMGSSNFHRMPVNSPGMLFIPQSSA